jgi:hypothetical protein
MYCRARLRRNSSTTSSKVVPSVANLRASVRVLTASLFATSCLRALPCGSEFCASFSTKARKVPGVVSRCLAASSQMGRFGHCDHRANGHHQHAFHGFSSQLMDELVPQAPAASGRRHLTHGENGPASLRDFPISPTTIAWARSRLRQQEGGADGR